MDAGLPHFSANVINTSAASYPSPIANTPHHLVQQSSSLSQTLPPLQPNNLVMQQPYGSYPHNTPRTSASTNSSGSTSNMASYPPPPPQNSGRSNYPIMTSNNPYQPPQQQQYPASSAMLPQSTTTAASHPQSIAPASQAAGAGRAPPVLRPMPAGGVMPQPGMHSPYAQSPLMPQPTMLPESGDQPTHVVGSQGRRGILPSAPGRPAAPTAGAQTTKNQIPQKDADGKFPCPHCTKTYLHAKHLKRHLLRHTGDRPYMCVLCRDTFSRSDILKRHFQKCSIRRGNPTGASHLSHPQAHVKKNAQAQAKAMGAEGDVNHMNGMGNMSGDGMAHPFGIVPTSEGVNNMANEQSQLSRSSSSNRLDDANRDRRTMPGPVMGGNSAHPSYNGDVPNNISGANINPQLASYSIPQNQTGGLPLFNGGQNPSAEWAQMFQAGAQTHTYVSPSFTPNFGQTQTATKPEPNSGTARLGVLSGNPAADATTFPSSWGMPPPDSSGPYYQQLSTRIIDFLRSASDDDLNNTGIAHFFHPNNIKDFLLKYNHFHLHFNVLHIPTFRVLDAHVGLVVSMCCLGACYSDTTSAAKVRDMMNFLKKALETSSRMFASLFIDSKAYAYDYSTFGTTKFDIEELQATVLVHILFIWHGTPMQRGTARQTFPLLAALARKCGLLRVSKHASLQSRLHQRNASLYVNDYVSLDWDQWVEQEKRVRLMYMIFLVDVSLGLYFNSGPEVDVFDIHLPLPADDAAWEARDARKCFDAFGLGSQGDVKVLNPEGTQRPHQPEIHLVVRALLNPSFHVQPGTTNLYGKYILIHALLSIMRRLQWDSSTNALHNDPGTSIQSAWLIRHGGIFGNKNGRSSPDLASTLIGTGTAKSLCMALDKFKANWDHDMSIQFPRSILHSGRYEYLKDGINFYWLAIYLLKNTRAADLSLSGDQRFVHVIHLLKSVKNWVMTDGASRGEELGLISETESEYGISYLTLDITRLFPPLPAHVDGHRINMLGIRA